jgi:hypothetical protein
MGLDQFAFAIDNNGSKEEIAYWRKHPNLQGWMENLWEHKGRPGLEDANMGDDSLGHFNCIPLELNKEDLEDLEDAVRGSGLPSTTGFFFGGDSDNYYKPQDLEFIRKARKALDSGLTVVYDSWW